MLCGEWVGRRVVVRRVVAIGANGHLRSTDVLGELVQLDDSHARIDTRTGAVDVALEQVTLARLVQPSTAAILALEQICAQGWRAAQVSEQHGWLLRANDGFTLRANSVLPVHPPTPDLPTALDSAAAWYRERGLPLRIRCPLPARQLLDAALDRLGWQVLTPGWVMVSRLDQLRIPSPADPGEVQIRSVPADRWLAQYQPASALDPGTVSALLGRHDRVGYATISRNGSVVAIARGAVDAGWLSVTAVAVLPAARRQGLASALMAALWRWGATENGATRSYLQVAHTNDAARLMYRQMGYWVHHEYRYRAAPGTSPQTSQRPVTDAPRNSSPLSPG